MAKIPVCGGEGVIPMEKKVAGGRFNPEGYGMIYCPVCKGSGKLFNGVGERVVCKICGGFGFIRKEEEKTFRDNWEIAQLLR